MCKWLTRHVRTEESRTQVINGETQKTCCIQPPAYVRIIQCMHTRIMASPYTRKGTQQLGSGDMARACDAM